jgi:hypothetical protein
MTTTATPTDLPPWRSVFRRGLVPLLTDHVLEELRLALLHDDPRLIQGSIVEPLPAWDDLSRPAAAACLIGFCAWVHAGEPLTAAQLDRSFMGWFVNINNLAGVDYGALSLIGHYDQMPREEMREQFLGEVMLAQRQRIEAGMLETIG